MSDRYWPDLVCEDHVPLGRERSRPQGPAGRKGQVVSVRVGDQDGAIIGIHHLASGDPVAVKAVARLDVDLVALGQLRKVDPVDVVRRDAGHPRVAGPHRRRIVTGTGVEDAGIDAFLDRGVVIELRDADREIDAVDRPLQSWIDPRRDRGSLADLALPDLVQVLLLAHAAQHPVREASDQKQADDEARQPQDAHGVQAANGVRGPGARQASAKGAHLKSKTRTGLRLASLEDEVEGGSSAYRAFGPDAAAVAVDDPSGGGQPDAGPLEVALAVQPLKGPEQPVYIDHVEANPVVAHVNAGLAIDDLGPDLDPRILLGSGELPGVVEQVRQQDPDQALVSGTGHTLRDLHLDLSAGHLGSNFSSHFLDQPRDVDRFAVDLPAGETEKRLETVEDRRHALAGTPHALQVVLRLLVKLGAVFIEQRLAHRVEGEQRRAKVVGNGVAERLQLAVDRGQRRGAFLDQHLELAPVPPELLLRAIELDEHCDFGAQDCRYDRREDKIDRTEVVPPAHVGFGLVERRYEDDRCQLGARPLPDELGRLEAVHHRHAHVQQHDREFLPQQLSKSIRPARSLDDVLAEWRQDRLEREAFGRIIVHDEDVDRRLRLGLRLRHRLARARHHRAFRNRLT